jgi:hypothetical protein
VNEEEEEKEEDLLVWNNGRDARKGLATARR